MDFDLSEDQRLLADSVTRMLADTYQFDARTAATREPDGYSRANWARFAEQGLLGLPFAEDDGGFGAGPVEMMIVAEAFGRALVIEPWFATVVLAGGVLRHAANADQRAALVPGIVAGETTLAFAHTERQSRYDLFDVRTQATHAGDAWHITGEKSLVLGGDTATHLIVSARTEGTPRDEDGIGLFLIEGDGGVSRRGYTTQDSFRAAEISLTNARAHALGSPLGAAGAIRAATDEALAVLCAEASGAMQQMLAMTTEYMKTRKQFGRAIGEFQALQHRAVDMLVSVEQAKSMAMAATMGVSDPDPHARHAAIAAAKVQTGLSGKHVAEEAVQLHGGIGVTMEYAIGHYMKRVTMIDHTLGDAAYHLAAIAASGGLPDAA